MPGGPNYYRMIAFEYLEHTADIKFRAYGKTPEEMLSNAAAALFKSMVEPATIAVKETWKVELEAPDLEDLAYQWLSEIVFLFETEFAVFATFSVMLQQNGAWKLQAEIGGERIDLKRHAFENEVKQVVKDRYETKSYWGDVAIYAGSPPKPEASMRRRSAMPISPVGSMRLMVKPRRTKPSSWLIWVRNMSSLPSTSTDW